MAQPGNHPSEKSGLSGGKQRAGAGWHEQDEKTPIGTLAADNPLCLSDCHRDRDGNGACCRYSRDPEAGTPQSGRTMKSAGAVARPLARPKRPKESPTKQPVRIRNPRLSGSRVRSMPAFFPTAQKISVAFPQGLHLCRVRSLAGKEPRDFALKCGKLFEFALPLSVPEKQSLTDNAFQRGVVANSYGGIHSLPFLSRNHHSQKRAGFVRPAQKR